jgi:hypothetical protein
MQSKEQLTWADVTCEKLSQVEARLGAATESLISMRLDTGPNERAALLREAVVLLEDVYLQWRPKQQQSGSGKPDFTASAQIVSWLQGIQARIVQLGQLNEAALGLCRGWLSAQPPPVADYTREGIWANWAACELAPGALIRYGD